MAPIKDLKELIEFIPELEFVCNVGDYGLAFCRNVQVLNMSMDKFIQSSGLSYATQKRPAAFGQRNIPDIYKICWEEVCNSKQMRVVPFIGHPFIILPKRWSRDCNNGPDRNVYNKEKYKVTHSLKVDADHSQGTTIHREQIHKGVKKGCPAKIIMKEVIVFPNFKGDVNMSADEQVAIGQQIRNSITTARQDNAPLPGERRIYILFPAVSAHKFHRVCSYSSLLNPVDKRIVDRIKLVLLKGVTQRSEMRRHLTIYVEEHFPDVPRNNTAFYPSDQALSSLMYRGMILNRYSHMDQERVLEMVSTWRDMYPEDYFLFRPQTKVSQDNESALSNDEWGEDDMLFEIPHLYRKHDDSTLLFVHQSKAQLHILRRYPTMVLMDATYKTCKLALPLFFLVVKTNVGYSVIAEFIIQTEDTDSIAEALGFLKTSWEAHGIHVSSFMVDKQQAEQNALRAVFPEVEIYLCDFHRLQAWDRFLKTGRNGLMSERDSTMKLLRTVAESISKEDYDCNLKKLHQSNVWNRHAKLRDYIAREWTGNEEMWVYFYRVGKQLYDNTNNGVESKNRAFKYNFLNCCRNLLMSRLLGLLVEIFVPLQCARYTADNAKNFTGICDTYCDNIPEFLKDRPSWFIRHCNNKLIAAHQWEDKHIIVQSPTSYKVESSEGVKYYNVEIDAINPRCSCYSWLKSELPCKHIFALLLHTKLEWTDFPSSFRNHPLFVVDTEILTLCDPSYAPPPMFDSYDASIRKGVIEFDGSAAGSSTNDENTTVQAPAIPDPDPEPDPVEMERRRLNKICSRLREQCALLSDVTRLVQNVEVAEKASKTLSQVYKSLYETCANEEGLAELPKKDLPFRTLRNKKPITPGFHGKRRIIPLHKPKSKRRKKNFIPPSQVTQAPLEDIIGDLPKSGTSSIRLKCPPIPKVINRNNLDGLLESAESLYLDNSLISDLSADRDFYDPFADILSFQESPVVTLPTATKPTKLMMDTCSKSACESIATKHNVTYTEEVKRRRILSSAIYYIVAKIGPYVLKDVDLLPLQGEHWQTDQLVTAYMYLLSQRFSDGTKTIVMIDHSTLKKIFEGNTQNNGRPHMCTRSGMDKLCKASLFIGAHLKDGNHWVLAMYDTRVGTFLYVDPLQVEEYKIGQQYKQLFQQWVTAVNAHGPNVSYKVPLALRIVDHAQQKDGRNCGIWTMWFARRILEGQHIMEATIGMEGAYIATEIMDASDSIANLCAKCGEPLNLQANMHSLKLCLGTCRPRRTFHLKCVPEASRTRINFKCEVCDNSTRDDNCYQCGSPPSGNIVTCSNGSFNGCTRFVHQPCLAAGSHSYRCGICTVRLKN